MPMTLMSIEYWPHDAICRQILCNALVVTPTYLLPFDSKNCQGAL